MVRALCVLVAAIVLGEVNRFEAVAADRYALLVGVREYDKTQLTNLRFSEADVTELADVLKGSGFKPDDVVLMTQTVGASKARALPTAKRIRGELQLLLGRAEAGDTVLVAFAGHGVQFKGEAGAFFCPMDAALDDRETLIPLAEVYAALEKCPARTKLLLVDACRNEVATELRRAAGGVELEAVGKPQAVKLPTGVASFFSCDAGQFAYEHPDLKHGVFFHFVLKGLRGEADLNKDQAIELTELDLFVRKSVKDYVATELGQLQSPRLITTLDGAPVLVRVERPMPPLAVAPFTAEEAKKHQQAWASYLKVQPVTTNSVNMKLALIPPGEFLMGSPAGETDSQEDEKPQHRVRITKPFYLSQTEVTIGQFRTFVVAENYKTEAERDGEGGYGYDAATDKFEGRKPKYTWKYTGWTVTDDYPVVNVSWNDAQAYCAWLTRKEGKTYRLPTEAEWEYACRAGTTTAYVHGNDPEGLALVENVADGSFKAKKPGGYDWGIAARDGYVFTAPVAQFRANGFGLFDMHGNVWEWCQDRYDAKYYETLAGRTTEDPQGAPSEQKSRVLRGGSWYVDPRYARSASRFRNTPGIRDFYFGFRCARTP